MIARLRLGLSTALVWLGARLAPAPMGVMFRVYLDMLMNFQGQIEIGRTYGVIGAPWWLRPDDKANAQRMADAASHALMTERFRLSVEARSAARSDTGEGA